MKKAKLVIFSSQNGSTFQAITEAAQSEKILAEVSALVVNRAGAGVIERAESLGIPHKLITLAEAGGVAEQDQMFCQYLENVEPDWIVLAGYMSLIGPEVLSRYEGRIINVHPSLLPKFGGQGMYGSRVHKAVIEAGESESGVTVHIVTTKYDEGPVLAQKKVEVGRGDNWRDLEGRIKEIEKPFYIETIQRLVAGEILV